MIVGVPREIKEGELRVSLTPENTDAVTSRGHRVQIETGAGSGAGFSDQQYVEAGATILPDIAAVYDRSELILKVKEILPAEYELLREAHTIFTYLHSANRPEQTQVLLDKRVAAIAYEDVMSEDGCFPLLAPMSELAGEVGTILGAFYLFSTNGGSGLLMGGAPGVGPAKVAILGGGNVGIGAARPALGMGAEVTILDVDARRLGEIRQTIFPNVKTLDPNSHNVRRILPEVDLLINAVKWSPGLTIVSRDMLKLMKKGALIVDIDCEPNGAIETCRYTTHQDPIFEIDGVRHCCISNLPSAVARTASYALSNATLPYLLQLADEGWLEAVKANRALRNGLDFAKGYLTFEPTATAQGRQYTPAEEAIELLQR